MNSAGSGFDTVIFLLAIAFICALLCWHFLQFRAALRPRRRTLEWITLAEPKPFSFGLQAPQYTARDVLPMVAAPLLSVLISVLFLMRLLSVPAYQTADLLSKVSVWITNGACPIMATLAVYCAAKRIAGGILVPFMAALLAALDVTSDAPELTFWLLSFAFFIRLWSREDESILGEAADLAVLTAFLAVGTYFRISAALLAAALLAPLVLRCILRQYGIGRTLLTALSYLLLYGLWYGFVCVPMGMTELGARFPQMLFSHEYWRFLYADVRQISAQTGAAFAPVPYFSMAVLQLYGVFCIVGCVYAALRRRDWDGLMLAWLGLCGFVCALLSLAPPSFFTLIACGYIWKLFFARRCAKPALIAFAVIALFMIAADVILLFSI